MNRAVISVKKEHQLQKIFDQYFQTLCFFAGKYLHDPEEVKDIVQEVYVRIWEKKPEFPGEMELRSFLYTSVYRSCINRIKQKGIHDEHHRIILMQSSESMEQNYISDRIEDEVMFELFSAIERLPSECRKVFKMSYVEGKRVEEVASLLNISTHTVKSQRTRAKKLLQEYLKDLYPLLLYFFI